jgi:hypothetical protein
MKKKNHTFREFPLNKQHKPGFVLFKPAWPVFHVKIGLDRVFSPNYAGELCVISLRKKRTNTKD